MLDHFGTSLIAFVEVFSFTSDLISRLTCRADILLSFASSQEQPQLLLGTQLAPGTVTSRALRKHSSSCRARALLDFSRQ